MGDEACYLVCIALAVDDILASSVPVGGLPVKNKDKGREISRCVAAAKEHDPVQTPAVSRTSWRGASL